MTPGDPPDMDDGEKRRLALDLIVDAWETALARGVEAELVASMAITAALTDMIDRHGEDAVARLLAALPGRVRSGEFTLSRPAPETPAEPPDETPDEPGGA